MNYFDYNAKINTPKTTEPKSEYDANRALRETVQLLRAEHNAMQKVLKNS